MDKPLTGAKRGPSPHSAIAFVLDSGVACPYPLSSAYNVASHVRSMYRIPNFAIDAECVLTHKMFNLPYRGAGAQRRLLSWTESSTRSPRSEPRPRRRHQAQPIPMNSSRIAWACRIETAMRSSTTQAAFSRLRALAGTFGYDEHRRTQASCVRRYPPRDRLGHLRRRNRCRPIRKMDRCRSTPGSRGRPLRVRAP